MRKTALFHPEAEKEFWLRLSIMLIEAAAWANALMKKSDAWSFRSKMTHVGMVRGGMGLGERVLGIFLTS